MESPENYGLIPFAIILRKLFERTSTYELIGSRPRLILLDFKKELDGVPNK